MKLWNTIRQKIRKRKSNIYRSSDTCPSFNYEKALEDKRFLYIKWSDRVDNDLLEAWENINDELMDEFGVDPSLQNLLLAEKRFMELNTEFILTGKRRLITDIEMARLKYERLKNISNKKVDSSFSKIAADLFLIHKIRVDLKETPIREFKHIIRQAQEHGKTV